jgi:hypothetical protein
MWALHVMMIAQARLLLPQLHVHVCSRSHRHANHADSRQPTHPPRSYRINSQSPPPPHPIISLAIRTDNNATSSCISFPFLCKHGISIGIDSGKGNPLSIGYITSAHSTGTGNGIYRWETEIMRQKGETTPCLPLFLRCFGIIPINHNYW